MGERIELARSKVTAQQARLAIQDAEARRQQTEQQLMYQESLLGTPQQIAGNLGGGTAAAPYMGRYSFDQAGFKQVSTYIDSGSKDFQKGIDEANALMEQAQAAAEAGNLAEAERLKTQAGQVVTKYAKTKHVTGAFDPSAYINFDENNQALAAARLNSPLAQTVGQNVAMGRAYADPNSAESRGLYDRVVTQPVARIDAGLGRSLEAVRSGTSGALAEVDSGYAAALSAITGGTAASLADIDEGFGRGIAALQAGAASSIGEINTGLSSALEAVRRQTENALRSIEAGTRDTRRGMVDAMRSRGSAARPMAQRAIQNRAEERFATQRAVVETESGRQQAALESGAASERAGVKEREGQGIASLESNAAVQRAGIRGRELGLKAEIAMSSAELKAQLKAQEGTLVAQLESMAAIEGARIMTEGAQFTEQFRANFSFMSVQQAQGFLQNQAGVREQYQSALDNLALAEASLLQRQSEQAQQQAQFLNVTNPPPGWVQFAGAALGFYSGYTASGAEKQAGGEVASGGTGDFGGLGDYSDEGASDVA